MSDPNKKRRDANFARHNREQARRMADQPLWVKIEWLEQAQRLAMQLAEQTPAPFVPPEKNK